MSVPTPPPVVQPMVAPVSPTPAIPAVKIASEYQPCNWDLVPRKDSDIIDGTHITTGRKFEGTMKEFNEFLRSK